MRVGIETCRGEGIGSGMVKIRRLTCLVLEDGRTGTCAMQAEDAHCR